MGASPFWLAPGLLDAFGPEYAPRVLWVGIGGQVGDLLQLQRHLAHALDTRGFALDGKPYAPHLTLARLTAPLDQAAALRLRHLRSEPPAREESWLVDSLLVMRSDLAPGGPRHSPLAAIPLDSGG
jgi:2'-5' RNA ligase